MVLEVFCNLDDSRLNRLFKDTADKLLSPSCNASLTVPARWCSPSWFACLFFGGTCSILNIQTGRFLYFLSPFQKAKQKNNLKSVTIYTEVCNPAYISQNTSLNWKPAYEKKNPNVGTGKCEKKEGERELCADKSSLNSTAVIAFFFPTLSCPVGMWAN